MRGGRNNRVEFTKDTTKQILANLKARIDKLRVEREEMEVKLEKERQEMWNYSKGRKPVCKKGSMTASSELKRNGKVVEGLPGAWELWDVGDILEQGEVKLQLFYKQRRSFELCPKCGSTMTFHQTRESVKKLSKKQYDFSNCFHDSMNPKDMRFMAKSDLCLSCGYLWVFEIFIWEELE